MTHPIRPARSARFYEDPPAWQDADGSRHWVVRGANFVVVATQAAAGADLARPADAQPDDGAVDRACDQRRQRARQHDRIRRENRLGARALEALPCCARALR